jgi:uncharacterized membrane protein YidH (DUF202 family)
MGKVVRTLSLYAFTFLGYSAVFLGLFRTDFIARAPLFYRGCLFAALAAIAILLVLAGVIRWMGSSNLRPPGSPVESIIAAVVLSASVHLVFFIVVPVTVDRSVTVFLLTRMAMADRGQTPLTKDELENALRDDYVTALDAVGRRLDEQLISGNVQAVAGDRYSLTAQGVAFLEFAEAASRAYGVSPIAVRELRADSFVDPSVKK